MELLLAWVMFAFLAAWIADSKGRSAGGVFLLSLILSPLIGIIVALVMERKSETPAGPDPALQIRCPECREWILRGARKCKHCGSAVAPEASEGLDCPECGARTPVGQYLCSDCGVRLAYPAHTTSATAVAMGRDLGKAFAALRPKPKIERKGWDKL